MYLFNSLSKKKEIFTPLNDDIVNIYSCGSTVYDYSHLGHARNAIVFDLLHRILLQNKYKVFFVKNYTDIDDKIINKAKENNISIQGLTKFYITKDKEDMQALSILPINLQPKATQYIDKMIDLVSRLLKKDIAYKIDNGIYLDISKDSHYGIISNRLQDNTINRVEQNTQKKNPQDFALWKYENDENISYNASFGRGRPGWHTECSAMIEDIFNINNNNKYIIDIHCGGSDLLFPHHENEASQIRCADNKEIAKYWLHNGFVQIDNEKMSKSLKNSFYLKDILKNHHKEAVRLYLMIVHYRANFNFTYSGLGEAKKSLDKIYRLKKIIFDTQKDTEDNKIIFESKDIQEALNDDMNTSKAISYVNKYISNANEFLTNKDNNKKQITNKKKQIKSFFIFIENIFAIGKEDPYKYFQFGLDEKEIDDINILIQKREIFREKKDYKGADDIKKILKKQNIAIMDTVNGCVWEKQKKEDDE